MRFIFFFFIFCPLITFSQLKKKYCGEYIGTTPAYKMDGGNMIIQVDSAHTVIAFDALGTVNYTIGNQSYSGKYEIHFQNKEYILLHAKLENQKATEIIKLFMKDKHLEKEGLYPQPTTILHKSK